MKNIDLLLSRCLFPLHTRLGWSQRRQCETLQDPQAWQRGLLHHHAGTVWHITEACQTLHRYVSVQCCCCSLACRLSPRVFSLIHYSSQSFITPENYSQSHLLLGATMQFHVQKAPECSQGRWIAYSFNNNYDFEPPLSSSSWGRLRLKICDPASFQSHSGEGFRCVKSHFISFIFHHS